MEVLIPLGVLAGALRDLPPALGRQAGALAARDDALEALLQDLARDRLAVPGPYPRLGLDIRVPAPPRDGPFRRLVLLGAGIIASPAVAPAVRLALAAAGPRAPHVFKRLAQVAEALAGAADPATVLDDPARGEELCRRVALALGLAIEGETREGSSARLQAVDARTSARLSREAEERAGLERIAAAIAGAAGRPPPFRLVAD